MKKSYYLFIVTLMLFTVTSSAQRGIDFGTDTTFEVATWNIEHFPKNGQTTIDYVSLLVQGMDIDFFALQEIESQSGFNDLVADLDGYEGYWAYYNYTGMAFLYKSDIVTVENTYKILTTYSRELPRAPLVTEITVRGESYVIIGNHYKCCGEGTLNASDGWDEETRRYEASVLLKDYIDTHFATDKVILVGDLNDEILDDQSNNVFQPFLDVPSDYQFADMSIAQLSASEWSYPSWPSHLDHIIVTNEVFEEFTDGTADVECLKPDEVIPGGWFAYDSDVSDHRPVALRMPMAADTVGLTSVNEFQFNVFPNPVANTIKILASVPRGKVSIFNTIGKLVKETSFDQSNVLVNVSDLNPGFYFINLNTGNYSETKRLVIER